MSKKKAWPTKDAMTQIYEKNLWGGDSGQFYSGDGSHLKELVDPYIEVVSKILSSIEQPLTLLDLGCGDFNIGKQIACFSDKYIGIDLVPQLIKNNVAKYANDKINFKCLDISKDKLPPADFVIIRQVLQHLSNNEVGQVVRQLENYKYILLTEHIPSEQFEPNKDIISGQGIRLKKHSGIVLSEPPFNLKFRFCEELLRIEAAKGCIQTINYTLG